MSIVMKIIGYVVYANVEKFLNSNRNHKLVSLINDSLLFYYAKKDQI